MSMISSICQKTDKIATILTELSGNGTLGFAAKSELWKAVTLCTQTNNIIAAAEEEAHQDSGLLREECRRILHDCETALSLTMSVPASSFPTVSKEEISSCLAPLKQASENAREKSNALWREYQQISNRLDYIDRTAPEFERLDRECDVKKAEYDQAHAETLRLGSEYDKKRRVTASLVFFDFQFVIIVLQKLSEICRSIIADLDCAGKEDRL